MEATATSLYGVGRAIGGSRWPADLLSRPKVADAPSASDARLRERLGEFVGNVFYGTLIRQMQASKLKGAYFHGGRGEEVFQGQLGMELARRMGRAPNDPLATRLYEAMRGRGGERGGLQKAPDTKLRQDTSQDGLGGGFTGGTPVPQGPYEAMRGVGGESGGLQDVHEKDGIGASSSGPVSAVEQADGGGREPLPYGPGSDREQDSTRGEA